jgi:hypothetical protein
MAACTNGDWNDPSSNTRKEEINITGNVKTLEIDR